MHAPTAVAAAALLLALSLSPAVFSLPALQPSDAAGEEGPATIADMIEQVDVSLVSRYLEGLVAFGPRYTGTENCSLAAQYIHDQFRTLGLWTRFDPWRYAGFESRNVVATLNGTGDSDALVLMTAHYDTVPSSPGADDDASGVASVLAAAAVLSQHSFPHSIRFVAFSGEEVGTYGSFHHARQSYERGDNIRAVINADMVGYAGTARGGRLLRVFESPRTEWLSALLVNVSTLYWNQIELGVERVPNYIGADHQAFLDYGYDALFCAHYDGYPWGHSRNDTLDRINYSYQVKATRLLLSAVATLAGQPVPLQVLLTAPREGCLYLGNWSLLPLPLGWFWFLRLRGITVALGSPVARAEVRSTAAIDYVIFCLDDIFITWDRSPPYEWKIQGKHGPPLGRHVLRVYAYDVEGRVASDEMDLIIYTLDYQYAPWNYHG
ncbi:MAG: M20/M25/M40 family metallo-hydrolase [Candidatus Thermoplasmatota archaeon]|nr:M20/M25/M40 family metallo-hydrolase [Candidatus Thermoplasmatota archaeon]